jgi:hypothetical protein
LEISSFNRQSLTSNHFQVYPYRTDTLQ